MRGGRGRELLRAAARVLAQWRALVEVWKAGRARAIGVSNFNITHLQEIQRAGLPLPAVNQCPFNPHLASTQEDIKAFGYSWNITFNGYSPFGVPDLHTFPDAVGTSRILEEPLLTSIAENHNRSPAEVVLSWQVANDVLVHPRSQDPEHMAANLRAVIDPPPLTPQELEDISAMTQDNCMDDISWYECEGTHGCNGCTNPACWAP